MELDWGSMDKNSEDVAPGQVIFPSLQPNNPDAIISPEFSSSFMSLPGLQLQGATDQDLEQVHVESEEIKKELARLSYPEMEGDLAPSAIVPKACQSIQKHVAKLDALLTQFVGAEKLSMLQERNLV